MEGSYRGAWISPPSTSRNILAKTAKSRKAHRSVTKIVDKKKVRKTKLVMDLKPAYVCELMQVQFRQRSTV